MQSLWTREGISLSVPPTPLRKPPTLLAHSCPCTPTPSPLLLQSAIRSQPQMQLLHEAFPEASFGADHLGAPTRLQKRTRLPPVRHGMHHDLPEQTASRPGLTHPCIPAAQLRTWDNRDVRGMCVGRRKTRRKGEREARRLTFLSLPETDKGKRIHRHQRLLNTCMYLALF